MTDRQTNFQAIGTTWDIQVRSSLSDTDWATLLGRVQHRIKTFDKNYSRFRTDSLISRISQQAGRYSLPVDAFRFLDFYKQLYEISGGKVTPLIGQTVSDSGYDANYSFHTKPMHEPPSWEGTLTYNARFLEVTRPVLLDFGAAGKGYLVDLIAEIIDQDGVESYLINAGGDMMHRDKTKTTITVGLENPLDVSEAVGTVQLHNQSLCASSGSKRKWGDFHHIIDPQSLQSPTNILATWVIAQDTMTADGLATALFFTSAEELAKEFNFAYALLDKQMALQHSKNFPVTIFEAVA